VASGDGDGFGALSPRCLRPPAAVGDGTGASVGVGAGVATGRKEGCAVISGVGVGDGAGVVCAKATVPVARPSARSAVNVRLRRFKETPATGWRTGYTTTRTFMNTSKERNCRKFPDSTEPSGG
jgi:hypothetical protein